MDGRKTFRERTYETKLSITTTVECHLKYYIAHFDYIIEYCIPKLFNIKATKGREKTEMMTSARGYYLLHISRFLE